MEKVMCQGEEFRMGERKGGIAEVSEASGRKCIADGQNSAKSAAEIA